MQRIESAHLSNEEEALRYEKLVRLCPSDEWKETMLIRYLTRKPMNQ